jgi:hypothetical protein
MGWLLDGDPYVDNDVSASRSVTRTAYQRLLADMEAGKVDAVVVWALDRLHRRPIELEEFIGLVERKGIALASGSLEVLTRPLRCTRRMQGCPEQRRRCNLRFRPGNHCGPGRPLGVWERCGYHEADDTPGPVGPVGRVSRAGRWGCPSVRRPLASGCSTARDR